MGPALAGEGRQGAVGVLLRGNQRDGAVVYLGGGVHHLKDALRARQSGQQRGHLLGYLVQGLAHLPGVVEVDGQSAQVEALEDGQQSAEGGGEGVADVHQIARHRHDDAGIEVGLLGGVPVGVVQLPEFCLGRLLVGKGFYHLQPLDGLLNFPVDRSQGGLLLLVKPPAAASQLLEQEHGKPQHQNGGKKQLPVDDKHQGHQPREHQAAGEQRDHALLEGHLHVVRVVGEPAHQFAVGVLVEVGQRELLQRVKQVLAQAVDPLLRQPDHHGRLAVGGQAAQQIDARQLEDGPGQPGEVGAARPDEVVDDGPHEIRPAQIGGHRDQQAQQHEQQGQLAFGEVAHQPAHGPFQIFGLDIAPSWGAMRSWHYSPTPSC